jgi:carbamoyl-phosphate synthase large subunit
MRRGITCAEINEITKIDMFFLDKIQGIIELEKEVRKSASEGGLLPGLLQKAKVMGFSDNHLARLAGLKQEEILYKRFEDGITPTFKMVDTCAAEFEAVTPYYYSSYDYEDEARTTSNRKALVLGSGPIRIGQGIEFDYCSVHSVWALREEGYEAIIINNNPETVSTDFDTADRLYFEPLVLENVLDILDRKNPKELLSSSAARPP